MVDLTSSAPGGPTAAAWALGRAVTEGVTQVVVGKREQIRLVLIALLSEGHVLIDDVPGVAKTLLVKTVAAASGLRFARVQCTPDLLPGDVTGSLVFSQEKGTFEFQPGPLFANLVLADEINRATPRTQSSFLEAMEERQVTVEGHAHALPRPFLVLATQNPVELRGTFPLPEAQLDRFLLRLRMGYPTEEEEVEMLERFRQASPLEKVSAVTDPESVSAAAASVRGVEVPPEVQDYVVTLVRATRSGGLVSLGASPRAALALMRAAQAAAALDGRDRVRAADVAALAGPVLGHRLTLSHAATLEHRDAEEVVAELVAALPAPAEATPSERA